MAQETTVAMPHISEKRTGPPPRSLMIIFALLSISHCTRSKDPNLTLQISLFLIVVTLPPRSVPLSLSLSPFAVPYPYALGFLHVENSISEYFYNSKMVYNDFL